MTKVDALLENFVHDTQGELMSPSTVSDDDCSFIVLTETKFSRGGTIRVPSLTTSSPGTFPTTVTRAPWERVGGA
jgi:hypothetical protein